MAKQTSFTLIELLVVIVIIGILAGVIMISTSSSIDKANIAKVKVFEESVQNNLAANMVSAWDADHVTKNGTSWTLNDKWGNNNGTFHNGTEVVCSSTSGSEACPQIVNDKQMGNVLFFDGVDDYIDCGNLGNPGSGTISLWALKKDTGSTQYLLDGRGSGNWWLLTKYNGFDVNFNNLVGWNGLEMGRWTYVVTTINQIETKLYINGDFKDSGNGLSINFSSVRIAARYTNVNYFNGLIDNVRIYDTILSSSKIKQNYVAGLNSMLANGIISKQEYNQKIKDLSLK